MEKLLKDRIDLMVSNYHELKASFSWDSSHIKNFGALVHANRDSRVDIDKLKGIRAFIKAETGWASYFRGANEFLLANLLCFEDYYKDFFAGIMAAHEKLREAKFKKSTQLPLAAYTLVKNSPSEEFDSRILRMSEFYVKMKENHSWLTSTDDYVFAALLAVTELDIERTTEKMEECYRLLHEMGLSRGNDLQTLSHILALGEETPKELCPRAMNLYTGLRKRDCKLYYSGLSVLGILTLVSTEENRMIDEVSEAYDYIYNQKGYGFWSFDKSMRTILSIALVSSLYMEDLNYDFLQIALGNCIHAIIISEEQTNAAMSTTT